MDCGGRPREISTASHKMMEPAESSPGAGGGGGAECGAQPPGAAPESPESCDRPVVPGVVPPSRARWDRRDWLQGAVLAAAGWNVGPTGTGEGVLAADPPAATFDGKRAYDHLRGLCELGPRFSGSEGMDRQQRLIADHFLKQRAKVKFQSFDARHPQTGNPVPMNNLIVSWQPQSTERVLLCCHYDTRPLPDRDPNPRVARSGPFVGANDGASGVALFMELGRHMAQLKPRYGIDFVLFDGEELVYHPNDPFFWGSEHFARELRDHPPAHRYVYGVLFDMIADRRLNIYQEVYSLQYAPQIVESFWGKAAELGVKEFIPRRQHEVRDDHLALNQIAGVPTIDVIDFDYDHWHTAQDTPANCSPASLAKVGRVLLAWLQDLPPEPPREAR